ncbi:hypothetical protein [Patulibacter americanus]|uniref:hypothetical protein n=1 Tax=Patulibacter americanus TaxID=588672 RepID=UPI0003B70BA3|nr:hypothetical protein [Patulibacter americanus]
MRVVSWNLFHGRAVPPAGRPLLHEFATTLAGWEWDVALLQEVPPWWPPLLARACGDDVVFARVRTSRNGLLPVRRALSSRRPDLLKANGGGANAILLRGGLSYDAHARRRLRLRPERRWVHAVRLVDPARGPFHGAWIGNVHGQKGAWDGGPGLVHPLTDLHASADALDRWAADGRRHGPDGADDGRGGAAGVDARTGTAGAVPPLLLGGDLNLPREAVPPALPAGWSRIASSGPDHVTGRGIVAAGDSRRPERGALSDHAALAVAVTPAATIAP